MKPRMSHAQPGQRGLSENEQARREILRFLRAMDSYPDRFAKEPGITFEQHLCSLPSSVTESRRD